jgi:hypothetical protein
MLERIAVSNRFLLVTIFVLVSLSACVPIPATPAPGPRPSSSQVQNPEAIMKQNEATGKQEAGSGRIDAGGVQPQYVTDLEAAYGAPSQAGFGSAVFFEQMKAEDDLTQAALAKYKYYTGELWERWGEAAWMGPWKEVYVRPAGAKPDIVTELRGITDPDAAISAPMILDSVQDAEKARAALAAAYDDPAVTELRVFNLGDGGAMSGILVAGRRGTTGAATLLVFLMD